MVGNELRAFQRGLNPDYNEEYGLDEMVAAGKQSGSRLEYVFEGSYNGSIYSEYDSIWQDFDLLPLQDRSNIVTLGEGASELIEFEELSPLLNGAKLYVLMDSEKNPTGTFKDREASLIISRCKELGLDNLVFYSTGNTGRTYTHYAAHLGLTTYFFMPGKCHYKNTKHIKKNKNNYIIYVDDYYPQISPYAKRFAKENGLNAIAPLHDRTEPYATVAYELFRKLPKYDFFVQTIASGMGPIGYLRGHKNLVKFGLERPEDIPRIICIQSEEMSVMSRAYSSGRTTLTEDDLPKTFAEDLFEPTLNSTNPVKNYPELYKCLQESNGIITHVDPDYVKEKAQPLVDAFQNRGLTLRTDLELSNLIGFAGLIQLAEKGQFQKDQTIAMLSCGRGKDQSTELYEPDSWVSPRTDDPVELKQKLDAL
ncbi:MAG: pyridoxal-phosphate dependent enzyme [Moorea sp. SIO1G6]|uniref:pyridoxal-phosphate dependent enzyme n=1 Tax=Moorena sp. SIO1G6 TaxID=2607840 RepID=UPI0013BF31BA|nr:pyridoxal-phosphate dependent enzyme [Moorena sp. SIO1G6]NEQ13528.1 pyridoxal-phosphate dependent enzyme [Moorena sp. SIO3E2]NES84610.1 pyridoxal-phosphate dependent enzyme [Moorena sp. SIO2B7]NET69370.1 pyridoxal-phosphate dependent enzyme [Moorena sp. SIO1G6]